MMMMMMMMIYPEDLATEDLAIAISSVAILGVCRHHDHLRHCHHDHLRHCHHDQVNVRPGDWLMTRCTYDTTERTNITLGGFGFTEEM